MNEQESIAILTAERGNAKTDRVRRAYDKGIAAISSLMPHVLTEDEAITRDPNTPVWIERHNPSFTTRLSGVMDLFTAIQYGMLGYGKHIRFWAGRRPTIELMDETEWMQEAQP